MYCVESKYKFFDWEYIDKYKNTTTLNAVVLGLVNYFVCELRF